MWFQIKRYGKLQRFADAVSLPVVSVWSRGWGYVVTTHTAGGSVFYLDRKLKIINTRDQWFGRASGRGRPATAIPQHMRNKGVTLASYNRGLTQEH